MSKQEFFQVHSMTRSPVTKSMRAPGNSSTGKAWPRMIRVGKDLRRLMSHKSITVTKLWLEENKKELLFKQSKGLLVVRTLDGALVNLEDFSVGEPANVQGVGEQLPEGAPEHLQPNAAPLTQLPAEKPQVLEPPPEGVDSSVSYPERLAPGEVPGQGESSVLDPSGEDDDKDEKKSDDRSDKKGKKGDKSKGFIFNK